jgi:hypothetical protein
MDCLGTRPKGDFILTASRNSEDVEDKSARDFILSLVHPLREGVRWQKFNDAVAAPEILLIGPLPGEKYYEEDSEEDENKMPSVSGSRKTFIRITSRWISSRL